MKPVRVFIVDDSSIVRRVLSEELAVDPAITVVGSAPDPYAARDAIVTLRPDVVTLDIEMPRMDGINFLGRIMKHLPMPVIVLSSLTPRHSELSMEALRLGAVDVVCKPGLAYSIGDLAPVLREKVKAAAQARPQALQDLPKRLSVKHVLASSRATHQIIAIGASTGGTVAIETVLRQLPPTCPGILITQHMPAQFTTAFAKRLDDTCPMRVREAQNGDPVAPGLALIAPGDNHLLFERSGATGIARVKSGPLVNRHRPSVDVLFRSVARHAGRNAVGVLLTGMGRDGASGLAEMRAAGGHTIAQDEASCVVFGMPREAIELGAVETILPLDRIAGHLAQQAQRSP